MLALTSTAFAGGKQYDRDHEYRFRRGGGNAIMVVPPDALTISIGLSRTGTDLPATLAALQANATLGEVSDALRDVFGVHRPG